MKTKTGLKKRGKKNASMVAAAGDITGRHYYLAVLVLWGVYAYLTFQAPVTGPNPLQLSPQTINILRLTIAIPYLFIWLAATYSFLKIKRYAFGIKPSVESGAFDNIASGVLLFLVSLILSTLLSSFRTFSAGSPDMRPLLTVLTNYAYVFPYLLAYVFLLVGAIKLTRQLGDATISLQKYLTVGIPLILFTYIWLEFMFTNPNRVVAGAASQFATYYLKDSLLILTIVIPSLITWVVGIRAILKLWIYQNKVKGSIYRRALSSLVYGLTGVILGSAFLQALLSLGAQRLLNLGLTGILEAIYFFLFLQIIGFFLIARGASNLTKIEEV